MRPNQNPDDNSAHNPAGSVNQFRKYAKYIALSILFGMLIISFGLWGVRTCCGLAAARRKSPMSAARHSDLWLGRWFVGHRQPGRDQFNLQLDGIQRQTGQRPEPEQAMRFGLHVRAPRRSSSAPCSTTPSRRSAWW